MDITQIVKHALMISGFVFTMMLLIEYINVLTEGDWQQKIRRSRIGQYLISSLLGVTPGCLGAFAVVGLYIHRIVSAGSLVAAMIATSGDEAFVMLAMFPEQALLIFGILFLIAIPVGAGVDVVARRGRLKSSSDNLHDLELHPEELQRCNCFPRGRIVQQWKECSAHRGILAFGLALFLSGVVAGEIGPPVWNWVRITIVVTSTIGLFIVCTVPEHFLNEHLWNHIVKRHILRVFLWTLGALIVMHVLIEHLELKDVIKEQRFILLLIACLIGVIPESGPHLIFVTFFSQGLIPFSVLLASSIVQDGHGMLPVLAHSRKTFFGVKIINLSVGLAVGLIGYWMNW